MCSEHIKRQCASEQSSVEQVASSETEPTSTNAEEAITEKEKEDFTEGWFSRYALNSGLVATRRIV